MTDIEKSLFLKASKGDKEAFSSFIMPYEKLVYNVALRLMGNSEDAWDVSQETIIKIYKSLNKCKAPESFKSWAIRITHNTCLDELRKRKGKFTKSLDEMADSEDGYGHFEAQSNKPGPEEEVLKKERLAEISQAIQGLSPKHRSLIILRDIQNLSYEEISYITGMNLGTVKSGISRARNALKEILLKGREQI